MIKRNIIYMKGGKEVHIQNINPNVIKKKKKEYKSKDAQNSLLQTLESTTRPKKKKGDYKAIME